MSQMAGSLAVRSTLKAIVQKTGVFDRSYPSIKNKEEVVLNKTEVTSDYQSTKSLRIV